MSAPRSWVPSLVDRGANAARMSEAGPKTASQLHPQTLYRLPASVQVQHGHLFSPELVLGLDAAEVASLGALPSNDTQQRPGVAIWDKDSRYPSPRMPALATRSVGTSGGWMILTMSSVSVSAVCAGSVWVTEVCLLCLHIAGMLPRSQVWAGEVRTGLTEAGARGTRRTQHAALTEHRGGERGMRQATCRQQQAGWLRVGTGLPPEPGRPSLPSVLGAPLRNLALMAGVMRRSGGMGSPASDSRADGG